MRTLTSAVSRRSSSAPAGRPIPYKLWFRRRRAVMTLPTPQPIAGFRKDRDAGAKAGFVDEGHGPLRVATPGGVRCEIEVPAAPLDPSEKLGSPDRAPLDKVLVQELFERSRPSHACVWWR